MVENVHCLGCRQVWRNELAQTKMQPFRIKAGERGKLMYCTAHTIPYHTSSNLEANHEIMEIVRNTDKKPEASQSPQNTPTPV